MAIVKIIAIRDRLDKRVNYAINGEKTTLDAGITYFLLAALMLCMGVYFCKKSNIRKENN